MKPVECNVKPVFFNNKTIETTTNNNLKKKNTNKMFYLNVKFNWKGYMNKEGRM